MIGMFYVSSYFHTVFSTEERRPVITPLLRERLWPFLVGIARQNKMKALEGVFDSEALGRHSAVPSGLIAMPMFPGVETPGYSHDGPPGQRMLSNGTTGIP